MAQYSPAEWRKLLEAADVPKHLMNGLVIDYMLCEGQVQSAKSFAEECMVNQVESQTLLGNKEELDRAFEAARKRSEINCLIMEKDIEGAIKLVNLTSNDMLSSNPVLLFRLKKHILLDKIQQGQVHEAVQLAQNDLAPLVVDAKTRFANQAAPKLDQNELKKLGLVSKSAPTTDAPEPHAELRKELEQILSLLIFDDVKASPLNHLLSDEELAKTASALNTAMLEWQHKRSQARLIRLIQECQKDQVDLENAKVKIPHVVQVEQHELESPGQGK